MSQTATPAPGPALPLFFSRVAGLNPDQHGALRLDRTAGYGFTARAASIPIGLGEFAIASRFYPIVFASAAVPAPVALVGLNELGNLFVDAAGTWRADSYVPAYVRAFPFVIIGDPARGPSHVGIEEGAACLAGPGGEPLFEGGKPTAAASEAVKLAAATRDALAGAAAFAQAMDAAGMLREEEATVTFKAGGTSRVRGFRLLAQDKLDALADDTFLDWRRRGWLAPIYAHLHSASNWSRLIDLAAERQAGG
jgi:hypothetical protein